MPHPAPAADPNVLCECLSLRKWISPLAKAEATWRALHFTSTLLRQWTCSSLPSRSLCSLAGIPSFACRASFTSCRDWTNLDHKRHALFFSDILLSCTAQGAPSVISHNGPVSPETRSWSCKATICVKLLPICVTTCAAWRLSTVLRYCSQSGTACTLY